MIAIPDPVTGIGISWLWMLPDSHPFFRAAVRHDQAYVDQFAGVSTEPTSKKADKRFLADCLLVSDTFKLKSEAYLFYGIVRAWGALRWPKPITTTKVGNVVWIRSAMGSSRGLANALGGSPWTVEIKKAA